MNNYYRISTYFQRYLALAKARNMFRKEGDVYVYTGAIAPPPVVYNPGEEMLVVPTDSASSVWADAQYIYCLVVPGIMIRTIRSDDRPRWVLHFVGDFRIPLEVMRTEGWRFPPQLDE